MTLRKKASEKEIKSQLEQDANDPDAWEAPITVPPNKSSRPAWYGQAKHLELAAKFYVLSVLHRLGAEANLTYEQPDNVDITVVIKSGEAFTIDVKTLMGTSRLPNEQLRARKHHFVVVIRYEKQWRDPNVVPQMYIWASEPLMAFLTRERTETVSLEDIASRLDPTSAWQRFIAQPV